MKIKIKIITLLGVMSVCAQNKKNQDTTKINQIEEIVVTSSRIHTKKTETPVAISKLTEKQITETKATAVYELVNKTAGVLMTNLGNEQHSMSIRQPMTTNAYFLYLEDGLPIRPLGVFNHNALLEINQFNIESIEVVKGPVSSLYGPEAVGGAVNFISKKPSDKPQLKLGYQGDQFHFNRFQAMGSGTIGRLGYHIASLSSVQKNAWMTYSDYDKNNINGRFDYTFNPNHKLIATVFYGEYYTQMSGSVNEQDFYERTYKSQTNFAYRKSKALRTKLIYELNWNQNTMTSLTTFMRENQLGQNPSYAIRLSEDKKTATGEINSNNFTSYGIVAQHNQKFNWLNTTLVVGGLLDRSPIDYESYRTDLQPILKPETTIVSQYDFIAERPDIRLKVYNGTIYNYAVFTQIKTMPIKNIVLTLGGRYDKMNLDYYNDISKKNGTKDYNQSTFKAGINYNPLKTAGFYANYSQGFSPPSVSTIFEIKAGTGVKTGVPAEFNYDLKPALFYNYEIGGWLSLINTKLKIDYSLYYMKGKNELINTRLVDNSTDYRSAGKTLHKGVEFGLNYGISKSINLRIGSAYSEHQFVEFEFPEKSLEGIKNLNGKEMPSAPRWIANSELSYHPKELPNFRISAEWQYVSSFYQDQINTTKYQGYNVINGRIGYKIKGIEAYLNIINLTDQLYAYNVSRGNSSKSSANYTVAAPRTFVFGVQYNLSL
ncbi:TonB-dependent receptor [Flavobacterium covae]|uniref:TonB-dependent receptor n=1 Tax=Flavobacterium covae TaxID=2906076 RepID=UPI000B4C77C9|nr:TonB-dependent receptor [Flavobacterium covae]OWP87810.1 TonB-dependent receptor [Flavobacterium covae]